MPFLRMWVHCPRASNGLLPRRSNLVGYVRWDAQSDRFPPCQTIIPTAFRSQSVLPVIRAQSSKRLGKITSTVTAFSQMSKLALPLCKAKANEKIRAFVSLGSLRTYGRRAQPKGEHY